MATIEGATDIILAVGALGTAAFGLVDASKAMSGGISLVGFNHIRTALKPFAPALDDTINNWRNLLRSNWINGKPKAEQKAIVRTLIRLSINASTAPKLAEALGLDKKALTDAAEKMASGTPLEQPQQDVVGRLDALAEARIDAAFEQADQAYRNMSKLCASIVAVVLALWGGYLLPDQKTTEPLAYLTSSDAARAVLVGLLAVPLAPIAKDVASSLQAAASALSKVKGRTP